MPRKTTSSGKACSPSSTRVKLSPSSMIEHTPDSHPSPKRSRTCPVAGPGAKPSYCSTRQRTWMGQNCRLCFYSQDTPKPTRHPLVRLRGIAYICRPYPLGPASSAIIRVVQGLNSFRSQRPNTAALPSRASRQADKTIRPGATPQYRPYHTERQASQCRSRKSMMSVVLQDCRLAVSISLLGIYLRRLMELRAS